MPRIKSLSAEENERVVEALRRVVASFPSQAEAGAALGVTQQSVSRGIGAGPVGVDMALAVARYIGVSFETLMGCGPDAALQAGLRAATDAELLAELQRRLTERAQEAR
jgi:plasmid maintenance system antidote protein VapI